jgi:hypothetical protein
MEFWCFCGGEPWCLGPSGWKQLVTDEFDYMDAICLDSDSTRTKSIISEVLTVGQILTAASKGVLVATVQYTRTSGTMKITGKYTNG